MKTWTFLLTFVGCLWAVCLVTYAAQVRNEQLTGKNPALTLMSAGASCSSSSSSSGE